MEDNASNDEEITAIPEIPPAVSDVEEEEQEEDCDGFDLGFSPIVTHTVSFKCMGSEGSSRINPSTIVGCPSPNSNSYLILLISTVTTEKLV